MGTTGNGDRSPVLASSWLDPSNRLEGSWSAMAARRRFLHGLQIAGNGLLLVNPDVLGIGANIALVEDTAGQEIELFLFQGAEQASANLGGGGDFVEGDTPHLALATQSFAECNHLRLTLLQRLMHLKLSSSLPIIESGAGSVKPAGNRQVSQLALLEIREPYPVKYRLGGRVFG